MRGHDESETSLSKGIFLEVYHFLRDHNQAIRTVTLENALKNYTLTSPQIQKDVVDCFPKEIVKSICLEVGADVFSLLVDESSDVSKKEQMAIVLRYVDKYGLVKERFVGIVQLRGHGYDGASNMRDMMRESYKERLEKEIVRGETETGKGKNQEDQTNLEAISLLKGTIRALKQTRASGFPSFLKNVTLFCELHGIEMVDMAESHSKGHWNKVTNQHHFEVDIFITVLDMQIQEFGDRFRESSTELLENMVALSLHNSFTDFNVSKLVKLNEMYPHDFTYMERLRISTDLVVYYQINVSKLLFTNSDCLQKGWKRTCSMNLEQYQASPDRSPNEAGMKPSNANAVRSMGLFRPKYYADGSLSRYKTRLVANGRTQHVGIDCDDTFSSVVKPATTRTLLSLALSCGWLVHQLDVKNTFLNDALSETFYISSAEVEYRVVANVVVETAWIPNPIQHQQMQHIKIDIHFVRDGQDIFHAGFNLSTKVHELVLFGAWIWPHEWSRGADVVWYDMVWFSNCISRHAFNMWLILLGRLKTQDKLRAWDLSAAFSVSRPLCNSQPDSQEHLFFECGFSQQLWSYV
nr:hypothetical protein [Tanacetum cinerariifolium]